MSENNNASSSNETPTQKHELDIILESTVNHLQTIASVKKVASVKGISFQISITQLNKYKNLKDSSSVNALSENYIKVRDFMVDINKEISVIRDKAVAFYEEQEKDNYQQVNTESPIQNDKKKDKTLQDDNELVDETPLNYDKDDNDDNDNDNDDNDDKDDNELVDGFTKMKINNNDDNDDKLVENFTKMKINNKS
tara:strand:+ start:16919 stop:17506 length:588 start_codon:yes stop_codon:yes gene_type:complete